MSHDEEVGLSVSVLVSVCSFAVCSSWVVGWLSGWVVIWLCRRGEGNGASEVAKVCKRRRDNVRSQ